LTVSTAGNVGIGTTSPSAALDVNGSVNISGSLNVEAWIAPTFQNSWVNYGSGYETAGYYKDKQGVIHLKGLVKNGTLNAAIFTLPAGYRPSLTRHLVAITGTAPPSACILYVDSTGAVTPHSTCNNLWLSIEASFRP
jgi:hypothetical protein